jgi:porin
MTRHRAAAIWAFAAFIVSAWTGSALAADPAEPERPSPSDETAASEAEPADLVEGLLRPFRKERSRLKELGITFKLREESELWGDLTGGGRRGLSYNGVTIAKLDIDLATAVGWSDAEFFVSAFDVHAHGPTRSLVGNQQIVSNNEARPSDKLYDLWLEQGLFDKRLYVRAGQEGVNDEMMITQYGALFLNSSFGFPGMPAADLPSGGPNYPMATPFARLKFQATDNVNLVGAVYNGDPAPPGGGDPQIRDRNGTAFRLNDHSLAFGEIWYSPDPGASAALPTTYKLGTWYSSSNFADQRIDSAGGLLASPASTGRALQHTGDWAIYGIIDQMVWKRAGSEDQGIGVFLQVMGGPGDRNLSNLFIEAGMNWLAPFPERKDDVFGLAFAYLGISPAARRFSRDFIAFGGAGSVSATNETVVEATYTAPVTSWLTLQPDIQLVLNPGAGIPGPFGRRTLADAVVIGTRAAIKF